MKKLPSIFKNENISSKKNNKEYCIFTNHETIVRENKVKEEISNIFSGIGHSYNIPVIIKTKNKEYDTYLVDRTRDIVITIENEHIKINDITSIKIKN